MQRSGISPASVSVVSRLPSMAAPQSHRRTGGVLKAMLPDL